MGKLNHTRLLCNPDTLLLFTKMKNSLQLKGNTRNEPQRSGKLKTQYTCKE